jgi:hypothetical protein
MWRIALIIAGWLCSSFALAGPDPATGIAWEVRHRFRVISTADHDRFMDDFITYPARAGAPRGRDANGGARTAYPSPYREFLSTAYHPERHAYDPAWFHRKKRVIKVQLPTSRGKPCDWVLEAGAEGSVMDRASTTDCATAVFLDTSLGTQKLTVRVAGETRSRSLVINVKDLKIAVIGDSFASGEGNPHVTVRTDGSTQLRPAQWWDERCHRSLVASSAQAAIRLAQRLHDTSITYVSFACSGATVEEGILGRYAGVELVDEVNDRMTGGGVEKYRLVDFYGKALVRDRGRVESELVEVRGLSRLPTQFDSLHALLCEDRACSTKARPDLLVVMTGGNELGFSDKIKECVLGRCRFTPQGMRSSFGELDAFYRTLAERLATLRAHHTFIMTYPNMTRRNTSASGHCNDAPFDLRRDFTPSFAVALGFGIKGREAKSAEEHVLKPLNAMIAAVAAREGWSAIGGYRQDRGFCAPRTWFHTFDQSMEKQGAIFKRAGDQIVPSFISTGAMHPNVFGHAAMADALLAEIAKTGLGSVEYQELFWMR